MQDDPSTSPLTHSATLRRLLYEALDALGLDPTRVYRSVYRRIPLPPPTLGGRLVHDNAPLFWTELAAVTGDADIGLHLGEAMKPRLLDVVGYLLLSARDLEEALRSFVRFQHILSGGFAARLEVEGETARLILDINYLGYASLRQQIECLMLLFLKLLALISDDEFVAERIEFRHRAPPRLGEHRRLFGRLPLFSRPHDALVFSAALLLRPSRNANPDMHDVLTRHAEEQSRELSENRLLNRVRYLIELRLGEGYGLRQCAAELGLGSGALQRALAAGGASFRQVRDEVRRQRASEMLLAGRAIREVAKACGFAELSPFYRAFRRWHAAPPEQYRARLAKREEGYSTSGT
ncbi:TPA: AraC family transcriptional regulator [Pseudomonas aeruginosa]|nr:AraC family transcriptional regulator [Pseudomonas aeruginosa]HEJ4887873.1 AraC family transcriptional regulator [Pseudomonas aeruginosa]HEJ5514316.1 AraC family transcriptional regulator [Pseudomonas aeruginosa]HEK1341438.1 AraC family transcriptional regulator [Pseudomonas aeruginosa]